MIQKIKKSRNVEICKKTSKNDPLEIRKSTVSCFKTRFGKFFNSQNPLSPKKMTHF